MSRRLRAVDHPVVALSIAGSDPSGGAGIQADLKTFASLGGYGCAVLTGLTAQNTRGVARVFGVPADLVRDQLSVLFEDVAVDSVKIGMLGNAAVAREVAAALRALRTQATQGGPPMPHVVLDPVMVATSGDRLLEPEAEDLIRGELLGLADLITPNLAEAAALLGCDVARTEEEARDQAVALRAFGPAWALVKGGHLHAGAEAIDHLAGPAGAPQAISGPRLPTANTHGTGCTLSSAIAVRRPRHADWPAAVVEAKQFLTRALRGADELMIGGTGSSTIPYAGHGPVHHSAAARPDSGHLDSAGTVLPGLPDLVDGPE